jgi:hypothetical protein
VITLISGDNNERERHGNSIVLKGDKVIKVEEGESWKIFVIEIGEFGKTVTRK